MTRLPLASPVYWVGGWLILVAVAMFSWPFVPIDETRYVTVAWEMWLHNSFLVPHLNGEPYSHKPPLLFWMMQAGWAVLGVNDYWPRMVPALFSLGAVFLTRAMARLLWPGQDRIVELVPFILLGAQFWALFTPAVMFDLILTFWAVLGLYGALLTTREGAKPLHGWLIVGFAIGMGVLTKGPVILLHILIPLLSAPWWLKGREIRWRRWYASMVGAVLLGAIIALGWAIPAALTGGDKFAEMIFWGQTAGRMSHSFAHARAWWWYVMLLPLILFPWFVWPDLWRAFGRLLKRNLAEIGVRFCLAWIIPVFVAFMLVSGKQAHYLLPLFPGFALLAARGLAEYEGIGKRPWPIAMGFITIAVVLALLPHLQTKLLWPEWLANLPLWNVVIIAAVGVVLLVAPQFRNGGRSVLPIYIASLTLSLVVSSGIMRSAAHAYDLKPMAQELAKLQQENTTIAFVGKYPGLFNFTGRLHEPLKVLTSNGEADKWASDHPDGAIIKVFNDETKPKASDPFYLIPYRGKQMGIWHARDILEASKVAASTPEVKSRSRSLQAPSN